MRARRDPVTITSSPNANRARCGDANVRIESRRDRRAYRRRCRCRASAAAPWSSASDSGAINPPIAVMPTAAGSARVSSAMRSRSASSNARAPTKRSAVSTASINARSSRSPSICTRIVLACRATSRSATAPLAINPAAAPATVASTKRGNTLFVPVEIGSSGASLPAERERAVGAVAAERQHDRAVRRGEAPVHRESCRASLRCAALPPRDCTPPNRIPTTRRFGDAVAVGNVRESIRTCAQRAHDGASHDGALFLVVEHRRARHQPAYVLAGRRIDGDPDDASGHVNVRRRSDGALLRRSDPRSARRPSRARG